jgi:hypothetical protein
VSREERVHTIEPDQSMQELSDLEYETGGRTPTDEWLYCTCVCSVRTKLGIPADAQRRRGPHAWKNVDL